MAKFVHAIDRATIPTVNILGVEIADINMDWLLSFTEKNLRVLSGDYITVANVHTTVTAFEDESYRAIQNGGVMAMPDGGPLSTVGRRRGAKQMRRTTGPGYMGEMFKLADQHSYRHYFYGATDETLQKLRDNLMREYPNIQIAGMYSPPFRPLTEEEDQQDIERINACEPDFIWVGLGAPKQEKWMAAHQGKVKGLMVGVGAGFDFYAGNIDRAPVWMQNSNLEWLYRLCQEPKRLFKRYMVTNTKFIWHAVLHRK